MEIIYEKLSINVKNRTIACFFYLLFWKFNTMSTQTDNIQKRHCFCRSFQSFKPGREQNNIVLLGEIVLNGEKNA